MNNIYNTYNDESIANLIVEKTKNMITNNQKIALNKNGLRQETNSLYHQNNTMNTSFDSIQKLLKEHRVFRTFDLT